MAKRTHKIAAEVSLDTKDLKKGTELSAREFNKLKGTFRGLTTAEEKFTAKQKLLNKALTDGTIDARQHAEAMKRLERQLNKTGRASQKATGGLRGKIGAGIGMIPGAGMLGGGGLAAGGGVALATGLTHLTNSTNEALAATGDFADRIGVSAAALRGLQEGAILTGANAQTLNMGLQRMTRRIAEAAQGTGEARGALQALNLNARELSSLRPDKQFLRISDALRTVPNRAEQVRLAFKLFDSEGVALVNTLDLGSEKLGQLGEQFTESYSEKNINNAREYGAAVAELNSEFEKMKIELTKLTTPALSSFMQMVTGALQLDVTKFGQGAAGQGIARIPGARGMHGFLGNAMEMQRAMRLPDELRGVSGVGARMAGPIEGRSTTMEQAKRARETDKNTEQLRQLNETIRAYSARNVSTMGAAAGGFNKYVGG